MIREEDIQKAKDATFPIPEGGRSYEQSLAASGFELGARWASALNEPNISFKELMIRSCIEIALTDVIEKRFSDYGTSLKECLEWIEEQQNKIAFYEKQGKQKPFDYEHATITQKDFASVGETATIELSSPIDCGNRIYHISHKPIEKNGEQKHINDTDEEIVNAVKDTSVLDMVEQKQEWSEEDENNVTNILKVFSWYFSKLQEKTLWPGEKEKAICFLKSLKDRVQPQPKQEWNEEDENMANDLIQGFLSSGKAYHLVHTSKEIANWLKSLKDRVNGKEEKK